MALVVRGWRLEASVSRPSSASTWLLSLHLRVLTSSAALGWADVKNRCMLSDTQKCLMQLPGQGCGWWGGRAVVSHPSEGLNLVLGLNNFLNSSQSPRTWPMSSDRAFEHRPCVPSPRHDGIGTGQTGG